MVILVDTNVLLDIFLQREKLYQESLEAIEKAIFSQATILFPSSSVKDIYYFVSKQTHNKSKAKQSILKLFDFTEIVEVNKNNIIEAIDSNMNDYEDAIIDSIASRENAQYIITRNKKDFEYSKVKAITPKEFLDF